MLVGRLVSRSSCLRARTLILHSMSMNFHENSMVFHSTVFRNMVFHSMGTNFHENSMNNSMLKGISCHMLLGTCRERVL